MTALSAIPPGTEAYVHLVASLVAVNDPVRVMRDGKWGAIGTVEELLPDFTGSARVLVKLDGRTHSATFAFGEFRYVVGLWEIVW